MKVFIVIANTAYEGVIEGDLTAYATESQATQIAWELNEDDSVDGWYTVQGLEIKE